MRRNVYSVGQVNAYIKNMFAQDFMLRQISVSGEISNCKYHSSGHIYFTLKDSSGTIQAVMFAGNRRGLTFHMKEGDNVVVTGSIEVYERDGKYQLYAREITLAGAGDLYLKYEALKKELEEMGMFAKEYKQDIPKYAKTIGIVTAPTGAAVRDINNIAQRRNPYVQLILYPALVQGEGAAQSIVNGIHAMEQLHPDLLIVGRGGGSIEDLWAFNTEEVARAVIACKTPVVSAVGHESDFTICDFVADLRAPTPSAAAELVCPDINVQLNRIRSLQYTAELYIKSFIDENSQRLSEICDFSPLADGDALVKPFSDRLSELENKLNMFFTQKSEVEFHKFSALAGKLNALSPLAVLERGFAVAKQNGNVISSVADADTKKKLTVALSDGELMCDISEVIKYEQ